MKNMKLFKNNKIRVFGGLSFLAFLSCFAVGFSSWVLVGDNAHIENNEYINSGEAIDKTDSIDLKFNKQINKSTFLANADNTNSDDTKIDKLVAKLSYSNNNYNSNINGNLNDYFYTYNPNRPYGEESPYIYNNETNQKIYFENHFENSTSLESKDFYSKSYLIPDTSNSSFDINEINLSLNSIKKLIDPMNGNGVEFQELSVTKETDATFNINWFKIYGSKIKVNDTSYQFRYHLFFKSTSGKLSRCDSSINSSTTDTATSDIGFPTITIKKNSVLYATKENNSYIRYSTSLSASNKIIYLNENNYNNTAGQSCDGEIIDYTKGRDDFVPYKSNMLSYIKSLSFNVSPTLSNCEVEYVSQDDTPFVTVGNFDNFYIYASRYKYLSGNNYYYRRYHFYIFYFSKKDGNIYLLYNTSPNGIIDGNFTSSEWPLFEICSNNMLSNHTLGGSVISNRRSNLYYNNRWVPNQYVTAIYNFKKNDGNYNGINSINFYFGNGFYNHINKNLKQSDFDFNALTKYLLKFDSNHNNPGTNSIEFKVLEQNEFPYLYFILSRRKTTDNKYYYNVINCFFKYEGITDRSNTQFAYSNFLTFRNNISNATNISNWYNVNLHSTDVATYPSLIADVNDSSITYLYFDISYYNEKDTLINEKNKYKLIFNDYYSDNKKDSNYFYNVSGNKYINYDSYNPGNIYSLYTFIDNSKKDFYAYLKEGYWYFTGNYRRVNISSKTYFNNKYCFAPSLYGFEYYSNSKATEDTQYKYITTDIMDSSYSFNYAEVIYLGNKENYIVRYNFKNTRGLSKDFYLNLNNNGTRNKYYAKNFFDKCGSDLLTFTYHINLRPKNEYVKLNYKEILKCFDFSFDLYIEEMEVF